MIEAVIMYILLFLSQQLLRLGHLLCIPYENNEREGIILQMCAEAAVTVSTCFTFDVVESLI